VPAGSAWQSAGRTPIQEIAVDKAELSKLERYFRRVFDSSKISVRPLMKKKDAAEVFVGAESVGLLTVDDEDGDRSFVFTMSILDIDLEE
jgi:hypothetical protein